VGKSPQQKDRRCGDRGKNAAQTALSELRDQHKQAQKQLDALNDELQRRTTLAGLNREIVAASKKLKALEAETAEAT